MAWQDPFEYSVEGLVQDLGDFLTEDLQLAAAEIARTQEVCRDFCKFIAKDIREATQEDYVDYLQLHSSTADRENNTQYIVECQRRQPSRHCLKTYRKRRSA